MGLFDFLKSDPVIKVMTPEQLEARAKELEESIALRKKQEQILQRQKDIKKKVPGAFLSKYFPRKVRTAWVVRNGSGLVIKDMPWAADGVVADSFWGRAAEIDAKVTPIEIQINNDARPGFLIDGDKGVAVNFLYKGEKLSGIETSAESTWAMLDTKKYAEALASDATGRAKLIFTLIGIIGGFILRGAFG